MNKNNAVICIFFLSIIGSACTVGPDFVKPTIETPSSFTQLADTKTESSPSDALEIQTWWNYFKDEELSLLISQALVNNQDLAIAESRVQEARAYLKKAKSEFYPGFQVEQSYRSSQTSSDNPMTGERRYGFELWSVGVDSLWEIDIFGGLRRNQEAKQSELHALEYSLFDVQRVLCAEVARVYLQYRLSEEQIDLNRTIIALQEDTLRIVDAKFAAGEVGDLDVARAQSALSAYKAELPLLFAEKRSAELRLAVLLGRNPLSSMSLTAKQSSSLLPRFQGPVAIVDPVSLLSRRPDLRALESKLQAANARVGVALSDYYPKISFNGNFSLEASAPQHWFDGGASAYSVLPSISWTIFDNGTIESRVEAANAQVNQALIDYRQHYLVVLEEVENALASFGAERVRRHDLLNAVVSSEKAYNLSKIQYEAGEIELLAVIDAQRALFVQKISALNSDANVAMAIIAIYKAFGGGWSPEPTLLVPPQNT